MAPQPKIWLKRVLIPFFVIEIIWCIIYIASGIVALTQASQLTDDYSAQAAVDEEIYDESVQEAQHLLVEGAAIIIAISAFVLLLDFISIGLWACHRLTPATQVVFTSLKTLIWLVILIFNIIAFARASNGGTFIWGVVLFANSIGQLIYCSIILHRHRRGNVATRGAYTPAPMPVSAPGFNNTAYNPAYTAPNPFRDPSPAPSHGMEPMRAPPMEFYSPDAVAAASRREEYQMQQTGYRSQV